MATDFEHEAKVFVESPMKELQAHDNFSREVGGHYDWPRTLNLLLELL